MIYLNLTEGFNPFNGRPEHEMMFEAFTFSGGEPHIKLNTVPHIGIKEVNVSIRLNSMNDLGLLMVAKDALNRTSKGAKMNLYVPYFPGARQDRVMKFGEPLTAKVYADIINNLHFDTVTILDPHSDVVPALVNNVKVLDNFSLVLHALRTIYPQTNSDIPYIISPDAGANKKIKDLGKKLSVFNTVEIIKCDKTRDVRTGKISDFEVYATDLKGKDCIIVDDICDGGGTFIGLAEKLKEKGAGDIYLIVSHGIFSKGIEGFKPNFRAIYTTDSVSSDYTSVDDKFGSRESFIKTIKL